MIAACLTALLLAQPMPVEDVATPAPLAGVSDRSLGMQFGFNGGALGFEWQHGPLVGFVSGAVAIPLLFYGLSGAGHNSIGAIALGVGYSMPLSRPSPSMWFLDVFGEALPGFDIYGPITHAHFGFGAGFGLRFLHESWTTSSTPRTSPQKSAPSVSTPL
jgi:hypothetical protein